MKLIELTRITLLSCAQKIGFTVPVAQVLKLILQKTRALKEGWNKHSLEEMLTDYTRWVEHL